MKFSRLTAALAVVLLLAVACSQKTDQTAGAKSTAPFLTSLDAAQEMAAQKDQYVLLDFYTDW